MPSDRYIQLLERMKQLHVAKSAGYAGVGNPDAWANFRTSVALGITPFIGCMVRASDKWIRITNLIKNAEADQVGENIKDTLYDLASYCLIAICLLEETEQK